MAVARMRQVMVKYKFEMPVGHPLLPWTFVHSAWVYLCLKVKAGLTGYEFMVGPGTEQNLSRMLSQLSPMRALRRRARRDGSCG